MKPLAKWYIISVVALGLITALRIPFGQDSALLRFGVFLSVAAMLLVYRSYSGYLALLKLQKDQAEADRTYAERASGLHLRTIQALAAAIEAKDRVTQNHLNRMIVYAVEIGRELKMPQAELEALKAAALLHDVGKLAVPEHILSKPGSLTPEEFEKMKIHTVVGAEIVGSVDFPYPVAPIVRGHHENWDGSGYPDRLRGEEIPLGARILAVVDSLDALITPRTYRPAKSLKDAFHYVRTEAGRRFDPRVVEVLERRLADIEKKASDACPADAAVGKSNLPEDFIERIGAARSEAQVLFELSQEVGTTLRLDSAFAIFAGHLQKLVPFETSALYLIRGNALTPECCLGAEKALFSSLSIPLGQGLSGWVAKHGTPLLNGNPTVEPGYTGDDTKFSNLRSALVVPLKSDQGLVGALALYAEPKEAFSKDHLRVSLAASTTLGTVLENVRRYREAEDSAGIDFLTELPNARALAAHLEREVNNADRSGKSVVVMVGDLDGFKQVNDQLGHLTGNEVLQKAATALKAQCRTGDFVARMGGDEFALVMTGIPEKAVPEAVVRFSQAVDRATQLITAGIPVALSLGVATYGEDGATPQALLESADRRMYQTKMRRKRAVRSEAIRVEEPKSLAVNE